MIQDLKEQCVHCPALQSTIKYHSRKLSRYTRGSDFEDLQNEFWLKIFEAVDSRYVPTVPVVEFARNVVYSSYGNMLRKINTVTHQTDVKVTEYDDTVLNHSPAYSDIESECLTTFTLDQIQEALRVRYATGRQYQFAYSQFTMLRSGKTLREVAEIHSVSKAYSYTVFNEIVRKEAEKFICG